MKNKNLEKAEYLYYKTGKAWENRGKIFHLLFKALKEGESGAAHMLCYVYQDMEITEQDNEKAMAYYALSQNMEDPKGLYVWSQDIRNCHDSLFSLQLLKKSADLGYLDAIFEYGRQIFFSAPYEGRKKKKKAADNGHVYAMYYLAKAYWYGYDAFTRFDKAFIYMKKAYEHGSFKAIYPLAFMYDFGVGTRKNYKKARELYEKVNDYEISNAKGLIGRHYVFGLGVKKDVKKGIELMLKAADSYNDPEPELMMALAKCYHMGIGVPIDHKKADECYQKAHETIENKRGHRIY